MRAPKEKPAWPERTKPGKDRNNHAVSGSVGKPLKNYAQQKLTRNRRDQEPNAAVEAEEQVEQDTAETLSAAGRGLDRASRSIRERPQARKTGPRSEQQGPVSHDSPMKHEHPGPDMEASSAAPDLISSHPVIPKEKQTTLKEKELWDIKFRATSELSAVPKETGTRAAQLQPPPTGERMKQAAARKRRAGAVGAKGGGLSGPPPLSEPVDGIPDSREGSPPASGRIIQHCQAGPAQRRRKPVASDSPRPLATLPSPSDRKSDFPSAQRPGSSRRERSQQTAPPGKARSRAGGKDVYKRQV